MHMGHNDKLSRLSSIRIVPRPVLGAHFAATTAPFLPTSYPDSLSPQEY